MSGANFNIRSEDFTQSRPGQNNTVYAIRENQIPSTLADNGIYEIDALIEKTSSLALSDVQNVLRGDGIRGAELDFIHGGTCFDQTTKPNVSFQDVIVDGDNSATLFNIVPTTPVFRSGQFLARNGAFRGFNDLGIIQNLSRLDFDAVQFTRNEGGLTIKNIAQIVIDDCFLGTGPGINPPDFWFKIDVDLFTEPTTTIDVTISRNRFVVEDSFAALYISPLLVSGVIVLVSENTVLGPDPRGNLFVTGDEGEITSVTDNLDGTVTISTPNTFNLADNDVVNILRTVNYNHGYTVSNVVSNTSFDITATFVDDSPRGTWHTGSLDQRDPRMICRSNSGTDDSATRAAGTSIGNTTATTNPGQNVWEPVEVDSFSDLASAMQRFAQVGDGSTVEFVYQGIDDFGGFANTQMKVIQSSGGDTNDYQFGWGVNGNDPVTLYPHIVPSLSQTTAQSLVMNQLLSLLTGDEIRLMARCTTSALREVLVENLAVFVSGN